MNRLPPAAIFLLGLQAWTKCKSATDQPHTDIELYNIRTDALGLALTALLSFLLPSIASGHLTLFSTRALSASSQTAQVARVALLGTMLHHAGTGLLAYAQWAEPRTSTGAMLLGWVVSGGLSALGVAAWFGVLEGLKVGGERSGTKRLRSGRKVR